MEIDDLLLTLAEISVTFAGLIGIMVAFTARDGKLSGTMFGAWSLMFD